MTWKLFSRNLVQCVCKPGQFTILHSLSLQCKSCCYNHRPRSGSKETLLKRREKISEHDIQLLWKENYLDILPWPCPFWSFPVIPNGVAVRSRYWRFPGMWHSRSDVLPLSTCPRLSSIKGLQHLLTFYSQRGKSSQFFSFQLHKVLCRYMQRKWREIHPCFQVLLMVP